MNDEARENVRYWQRGPFTTPGIAFASHIIFTAQTSCISEQTESFSDCPNCATIQHGYQRLEVENINATDVIG